MLDENKLERKHQKFFFICVFFGGVEDMLILSGIWNHVIMIVTYIFNIDYSNIFMDVVVGWALLLSHHVIPLFDCLPCVLF